MNKPGRLGASWEQFVEESTEGLDHAPAGTAAPARNCAAAGGGAGHRAAAAATEKAIVTGLERRETGSGRRTAAAIGATARTTVHDLGLVAGCGYGREERIAAQAG